MKAFRKFLSFFLLFIFSFCAQAQDSSGRGGGFMRDNGRSAVVIAVMLTILLGLIFYLIRLERKIKKLENQTHS